jgi:hypothetical protein
MFRTLRNSNKSSSKAPLTPALSRRERGVLIEFLILSTLVTFAFAASSHAGNVQVNFSGGSGSPLTITLPQAVSFTVTNDTAGSVADFVFLGVGNFIGGSAGVSGTLSYTTNGGGLLAIDRAGTFPLGVVTANDMSLFKNSSPGVNLGDVLVLSSGSVTTSANISAAAPPSGLYSAIFVDINGTQLGVGTAVPAPFGDYNVDGLVNAADYVAWRKTDDPDGYDAWRAHFGESSGSGAATLSFAEAPAGVPEPASAALLLIFGATVVGWWGRRRGDGSRVEGRESRAGIKAEGGGLAVSL